MCIFCKIINREMNATIVYEDDDTIVILDTNPLTKGHTLVMPKQHYKNILDTPVEVFTKVMTVAQQISKEYIKEYQMEGFNLAVNNNAIAFQAVDHLHVHIIPRYNRDELNYFSKRK